MLQIGIYKKLVIGFLRLRLMFATESVVDCQLRSDADSRPE